MKKHLLTYTIMALLLYACGPVYVVHQDPPPQSAPAPAPDPEVSYQSFYDQLSPYGQWIDDPTYGYVWMPEAGPDFKPYATNGHWVYTDEGWTWASDYTWGWAVFHYGRWFFQDGYGWMWMPGHEWAPAWVSWRNSPDYYGWAPLGPNVSINISVGGGYNPPPHYWCFVPHEYITSPQVRNYYINENRNVTIIHNTTIINNTTVINNNNNRNRAYAGGPDPREAGRYGGRDLRAVSIRENNTPGEQMNNGGFSIYRPRINPNTAPHANPSASAGNPRSTIAPPRIQTLNNARPVNTMRYTNEEANNSNGSRDNEPGRNNNGYRNNNSEPNGQPGQGQSGQNSSGQPSNPGQPGGRFGQPGQGQSGQNQTGQNQTGQNSSGQPANPGQPGGRFGQPGQGQSGHNSSGQPANPGQPGGRFGQPGQGQSGQNQTGQNSSGQPSNPGQHGGRFGQPGQVQPASNGQLNGGRSGQTTQTGAATQPAQTMSPGRRTNTQNGTAPAMNTIHPIVKPAPQGHPVDDKPKDDDKKRDKKES